MLVQGRSLSWGHAVASVIVRCGGMVPVMQGSQVKATPNEKNFRCQRQENFLNEWDCRTEYATLLAVQEAAQVCRSPEESITAAP